MKNENLGNAELVISMVRKCATKFKYGFAQSAEKKQQTIHINVLVINWNF